MQPDIFKQEVFHRVHGDHSDVTARVRDMVLVRFDNCLTQSFGVLIIRGACDSGVMILDYAARTEARARCRAHFLYLCPRWSAHSPQTGTHDLLSNASTITTSPWSPSLGV
jgi:hypothetical protein